MANDCWGVTQQSFNFCTGIPNAFYVKLFDDLP